MFNTVGLPKALTCVGQLQGWREKLVRVLRHLSVVIVAIVAVATLGLLSGTVTRQAAACDDYGVIWGPIPVNSFVQQNFATSKFAGTAETDRILFGSPCVEHHQLNIAGTLTAQWNYNQNVFWRLWLPSGMPIGNVYLGSNEWIAKGGAGSTYVYIGQSTGCCGTVSSPSANAAIPSSFWGHQFTIVMQMGYNTPDCQPYPFGECGEKTSYVLVG